VSRRRLLTGGLATAGLVAAAGGLSGCSSALSAGLAGTALAPGTVTYWNLFGGGDGARMQAMEATYEQAHGSGSLQAATFTWGNPYYTKVSLATLGDAPPDVAVSHLTRSKNLAQAGLLTPITDEMLALVGLRSTDFDPKPWQAQQVAGQNFAIPLDTHPFVLYYNLDVCQQAGLLDADGKLKPIQGAAAWEDALKAAKKATGAYGAAVSTIGDQATAWRWFQTLYSQQDGATPFLGEEGRTLTYNHDLALKTLSYIQSLSKSGLMPANADYAGAETMMFTGQAAFYLEGEWEITTAQASPGLKFGMTLVPTLFDKPATQADSHCFVLPRMTRTDEQLLRALTFVKSMLDQSLTWAQGGHIPAFLPTRNSDQYKNLRPQADYAAAADLVQYDPPAWYSGSGSNFENIIGAQIGLVQQGLTSPEAALESARSQLQTLADTPSPL
jgi:multiple sugar transport system substrate-binding protein